MALMDRYLPEHQFEERHSRTIKAPPGWLLDAAQTVAHQPDPLVNRLIGLRELPARLMGRLGQAGPLPARPFGIEDFTLLGRDGDHELAFGLAGRFWQPAYGLKKLHSASEFEVVQSLPKLVLNFIATPLQDSLCELSTTTRVWCPDAASQRAFTPYWYLIRPVSGLIRKRLLARIDQHAHNAAP
jgi:hypothetical protein